jgi:heterodisulfide reductase subunit B
MQYLYYPGCSAKGTGYSYEISMQTVFKRLGAEIEEIHDWNCCGSTAGLCFDKYKTYALAARNLALAERQFKGASDEIHILCPCNACLQILVKTDHCIREDPVNGPRIKRALEKIGLSYTHKIVIRHPLDIILNDIGLDAVRELVTTPLKENRIACYYGCQMVRPFSSYDDQHNPTGMEDLMDVLGVPTVSWALRTSCCGSSLTGTLCCGGTVAAPMDEVGLRMSYNVIKDAQYRGADAITVACPLCQLNLECYQDRMRRLFHDDIRMPIVCITQLMGLAMGIPEKELGLNKLFVPLPNHSAIHQEEKRYGSLHIIS